MLVIQTFVGSSGLSLFAQMAPDVSEHTRDLLRVTWFLPATTSPLIQGAARRALRYAQTGRYPVPPPPDQGLGGVFSVLVPGRVVNETGVWDGVVRISAVIALTADEKHLSIRRRRKHTK